MEDIDINVDNTLNGILLYTVEVLEIDDSHQISAVLIDTQPAPGTNFAMFL